MMLLRVGEVRRGRILLIAFFMFYVLYVGEGIAVEGAPPAFLFFWSFFSLVGGGMDRAGLAVSLLCIPLSG